MQSSQQWWRTWGPGCLELLHFADLVLSNNREWDIAKSNSITSQILLLILHVIFMSECIFALPILQIYMHWNEWKQIEKLLPAACSQILLQMNMLNALVIFHTIFMQAYNHIPLQKKWAPNKEMHLKRVFSCQHLHSTSLESFC